MVRSALLALMIALCHTAQALQPPPAQSQKKPSSMPTITPKDVIGSMGAGYVNFTVKSPDRAFELDRGIFAGFSIERGFNVLNAYLTFSLDYTTTMGHANYDYKTLAGTRYQASNVEFQSSTFQAGLGLKIKLIDGYWFRPYVEGGGLGGYYQIRYTNKEDVLKLIGSDYKTTDAMAESGYYGEAGIEAAFSDAFGLKLSARYAGNATQEVPTLANEEIRYEAQIYYLSMMVAF